MTIASSFPHGAEHFRASAQRVVDYLNVHSPLGDWSVSRVAGGRQVHLHVHRESILEPGLEMAFDDGFCSRMIAGADAVVHDTRSHPAYRDLAVAEQVRAYAGVPIANEDGSLFGVLCGFSGRPLPADDTVDEQLLALLSDMLSGQLTLARQVDRGRRQLEISEALNSTDRLTGLLNRHGWDAIVTDAQERLDAYGDPISVAVIDLDSLKQVNDQLGHQAGDDLLTRAADALRETEGLGDRIARYGGDEFAILAHNVEPQDVDRYFRRFQVALDRAGAPASLGSALALPVNVPVDRAFALADTRMYDDKRARRGLVEAVAG